MGFSKKKVLGGLLLLLAVFVIFQMIRGSFAKEEKQIRSQVRASVQQQFPDAYQKMLSTFGLQEFTHPLSKSENLSSSAEKGKVILVHGLDDPGIIWQNLAPVLTEHGYRVWIFNYPNDQPIVNSAKFFKEELERFAAAEGQGEVALVCHSMGGLVTREMLTRPELSYQQKVEDGQVPPVSHLIMVGTPNHGSIFARLRIFSEIRDQLVNAGQEEFHWLRVVFDGLGEAGIDLYPGSDFLIELNSRLPADVPNKLVVAGVMAPLDQKNLQKGFDKMRESFPQVTKDVWQKIEPLLDELVGGVGDGLVSVDSARLPGVSLVKVQGTHVSIIRNLLSTSSRTPPAIPIILEELAASPIK